MQSREKILAIIAFTATGLVVLYLLVVKMIIEPVTIARRSAQTLEIDVDKLQLTVDSKPRVEAELHGFVNNSYGDTSSASEMSRAYLVKLISRAGIGGEDLSMIPVQGKRVGGGIEIGWVVVVKGSQPRLTELLFQLQTDAHLHKVDTVSWTPVNNSTELTLKFRFATLVLDKIEGATPPVLDPDKLQIAKIDDKEKKVLAMITERDIFRPYIKQPPPPVRPQPPQTPGNNNPPPQPGPAPTPPPPPVQLVALPSWGSSQADVEVMTKDLTTQKTKTHKIGESLMGGEIMMVDYRPLPLPNKPEILSTSRVLVMIGPEIYAVELGQKLSDRYKVSKDRMPDEEDMPEALRSMIKFIFPAKPATPAPSVPAETPKPDSTLQTAPDSSTDAGTGNKEAAQDVTRDGVDKSSIQPSNAAPAPATGSEPPTKEAGNAP